MASRARRFNLQRRFMLLRYGVSPFSFEGQEEEYVEVKSVAELDKTLDKLRSSKTKQQQGTPRLKRPSAKKLRQNSIKQRIEHRKVMFEKSGNPGKDDTIYINTDEAYDWFVKKFMEPFVNQRRYGE